MNYSAIRTQLSKIAEIAKVAKRINPHSFRHARATHLTSKGLNPAQLSGLFGLFGAIFAMFIGGAARVVGGLLVL